MTIEQMVPKFMLLTSATDGRLKNLRLDLCQSFVQIGQEILSGSVTSASIFAFGSIGTFLTGCFAGFTATSFGFLDDDFPDTSVLIVTLVFTTSFDPFEIPVGNGNTSFADSLRGLIARLDDGNDWLSRASASSAVFE